MDRLRHDACGSCERKDACADLFAGLFAPGGAFARRDGPPRHARKRGAERPKNPFLSFLGQVAKAIESTAQPRRTPVPRPAPFSSEVERRLEPMLAAGGVRIDEVARALGLSRQTLYRRLKAEGVTFEEILDALRRRLALRMLRQDGLSVKETAYRLGFSDPAAFSRAFKRWTGSSPSGMQR